MAAPLAANSPAFRCFMDHVLQPGVFQTPPYTSVIDVRDLSNFCKTELQILDRMLNPGWREMERSLHRVDRYPSPSYFAASGESPGEVDG